MKQIYLIIIFCLIIIKSSMFSQNIYEESFTNTNLTSALISVPVNTPLSSALINIGQLIKAKENKFLINNLLDDQFIVQELINVNYKDALYILANTYNFKILSTDTTYIATELTRTSRSVGNKNEIYNSKQIKVHALLFEANTNELKKRGVNWQAILSKHGMVLGADVASFLVSEINPLIPEYTLNLQLEGDIGPFSGYTNALLSFLESEQLGEVEAKLSITVRDGQKGIMQVGSDISIKQKDFAGNVLDVFYPTGTIIDVTPTIYAEDTLNFTLLNINVERSFAIPGELSTEIKKTQTKSELILKDGDEAIVAGLVYNQFIKVRTGIPILRDLPWWVLGLRYLTGTDKYESLQKEVVLIIKSEVIPSIKEQVNK